MPTARKLPSRNWFVRVQKTIDGQTHYMSFTAETKAEAEYLADQWKKSTVEQLKPSNYTLDKAIDIFIENHSNILSPSTIRGYRIIQRNAIDDIKALRLREIDSKRIQQFINKNANRYSHHSLKNQLGLITRVLSDYEIKIKVKLPPKEKIEYNIPTVEEIKKIIEIVKDTDIEIPILFALMLGLRKSEIAGLKWENLKGNKITIHGAIVPDEHHQWVEKKTNKSYASARTLEIPDYLMDKLQKADKECPFIMNVSQDTLLKKFRKLTNEHNLPPFRIHDLRHANASIMLLLGISDKYAMERLGQSDPSMIKNIYQHTFKTEHEFINAKINNFFSNL